MKITPQRVAKSVAPYGALVAYRRAKQILEERLEYDNQVKTAVLRSKKLKNTNNPKIVVSLTSYGPRLKSTAPFAIASLFNQTFMPDKIVLWLAKGEKPSRGLKKLVELGLEINYTNDIKSYKKLIPSLIKYPKSTIVTVDDDILYPESWLEITLKAHKKNPKAIIANRARQIVVRNGNILPYNDWPVLEKNIRDSHLILPNGAGGILYPKGSLAKQVFNEDQFMSLAPHGDDLWFWAMSELQGSQREYIEEGFHDVFEYELDRFSGLSATVNGSNNNDKQLSRIMNEFPELYGNVGADLNQKITTVSHGNVSSKFNITNPDDWIQKIQISTGEFYEKGMLADIEQRLEKSHGNVIIDAGAYIGNHSIFFATHCNAKQVISFEPFRDSYDQLIANVKLNNLEKKVLVHNVALGDKKRTAKINITDASNKGANMVDMEEEGDISITTLDSLLGNKLVRLDVIKVDVEGMEIPLLKGALNTIEKFSPLLYIEAFDHVRLKELLKILTPLGYSIVDVFNATPTYLFVRNNK